jgi:hypothetical protein
MLPDHIPLSKSGLIVQWHIGRKHAQVHPERHAQAQQQFCQLQKHPTPGLSVRLAFWYFVHVASPAASPLQRAPRVLLLLTASDSTQLSLGHPLRWPRTVGHHIRPWYITASVHSVASSMGRSAWRELAAVRHAIKAKPVVPGTRRRRTQQQPPSTVRHATRSIMWLRGQGRVYTYALVCRHTMIFVRFKRWSCGGHSHCKPVVLWQRHCSTAPAPHWYSRIHCVNTRDQKVHTEVACMMRAGISCRLHAGT